MSADAPPFHEAEDPCWCVAYTKAAYGDDWTTCERNLEHELGSDGCRYVAADDDPDPNRFPPMTVGGRP